MRGGPVNHRELARRLGEPSPKVCVKLEYMHRKGMVRCLQRPGRGPQAAPGVWNLIATEPNRT